jgi:hypothetical protein
MDKMTQDKARKWDGKSRVSNDTYRKRWEEIFKPKEELKPEDQEYLDSLKKNCNGTTKKIN